MDLTTVNKIALLNNIGFSDGEKNSVLYYMNTMSSKGLHIKGFGVVRNGFLIDKEVRYIYAGCKKKNSVFFDDNSGWEHVLDRFGIAYYRKKLPVGFCTFDENFINDREEAEWLYDRMEDGYLLCGVNSGEYIFERPQSKSGEYGESSENGGKSSRINAEYSVDILPAGKELSDFLLAKQDEGWNFIAVSTDGKKCYFCRERSYELCKRAERIKKSLRRATVSVAACMTAMAATLALTFWGIYQNIVSGDSAAGVFLIGGFAAAVLGVLLLAELSRRYMLSERYARILEHVAEVDGGTSFGDTAIAAGADSAESAASVVSAVSEKAVGMTTISHRLFCAVTAVFVSLIAAVGSVIYCYAWFTSAAVIALGAIGNILLAVCFLVIGFLPFVLYGAINVITEIVKHKK